MDIPVLAMQTGQTEEEIKEQLKINTDSVKFNKRWDKQSQFVWWKQILKYIYFKNIHDTTANKD